MARPEAEIDGSTPEGDFALRLRALRDKARLDYRAMEKLVHFASSTLSKAASGNGLPTLEVTLAYVRACGGDEQEWEARWHELRRTAGRGPRAVKGAVPSQRDAEGEQRTGTEKSPDRGDGSEHANEPDPELPRIPEQVTGDQIADQALGGGTAKTPDPEATDRIPRTGLPAEVSAVPRGPLLEEPRRQGTHRAVQQSPRRASAWVVVVLILLNLSSLAALAFSDEDREPAAQSSTATTTVATSIQSFEIAELEEPPIVLKAGAKEIRWVDLRNPNATDLVVIELIAQVKVPADDSVTSSRSCSAEVLKISNLQYFPYRIDARGTTRVGFEFEVSARLPEGCEGRAVPIAYAGKAIQGTVVEGKLHVR
ncbi:Helix-turn-helix domain-containing protein [Lentzea xinjiangensis]|uniref:Helix-turn-helix domain-containing protein n=1 Tax=Lentzea xinjiangensis TaxID=402600 RepID=A0A1H9BD50_9PSEU|nr:helix-turn-helix transcriptional regulator [Lentzea xinjiangensis]SEP86198.1 Helix-turn-helix domain-containing protein [Lentzea xinjiangensis]